MVIPDVFANLCAGESLAGGAEQVGEERKLPRGEFDDGALAADFAGDEIDGDVAVLEEGEGGAGGAAGDGVEPGDELVDVERFREIIIGTEVEPFEAFVESAAGGDEDDGDGEALVAEVAQDAQAVAAGDHDIKDEGVVGACGGERVGIVAVVAEIDREALRLEALTDEGGELLVVFHHQDFHLG